MRNLIIYYEDKTLKTRQENIPIPSPGPNEVLVKVHVAGSNPKDYKHPLPHLYNNALNQGDDCAGTVAVVGSDVKSFQIGERVAGFHEMDTLNGTYADYALCPEHTVFRIPPSMSYEEAATLPLAAYTAAVGLYRNLSLPAPWERSDANAPNASKVPLVVNAASSAVGAFAVKLAKLNPRISPIIATAGSSSDFVASLGPDAVVDYRSGTIVEDLRKALGGAKLRHVFDATNSIRSIEYLTAVMEPNAWYSCTSALYSMPEFGIDDSMEKALQAVEAWYEIAFVADVHGQSVPGTRQTEIKAGGVLFGKLMTQVFEQAVAEGTLTGHPYQVVEGGLAGIRDALIELKQRKKGGNAKFVTRIADTT